MRKRTLQTSMNLLMEQYLYDRLKLKSRWKRIPMSRIIRNGIKLELDRMDREEAAKGGKR
jgi:hypothetical protein